MPRQSGLTLEKSSGRYITTHRGQKVRFTRNKRESQQMLRRLLLDNDSPAQRRARRLSGKVTVGECLRRYVRHKRKTASAATVKWELNYLRRFEQYIGAKELVANLIAGDATEFIDEAYDIDARTGKSYGQATRHAAGRVLKACFKWNDEQGYLVDNPLKGFKAESAGETSAKLIDDNIFRKMDELWAADRDYLDVLWFLRLTGCRVQEVRVVGAEHYDSEAKVLTIPAPLAKKRRLRRIILTTDATEIVERNTLKHPAGAMFRNSVGEPWTASAIRGRLRQKADQLGQLVRARDLRHTFATDFLKKGGSVATLKELMGHADERMIMRIYQHLAEDPTFLRSEAERVRRETITFTCDAPKKAS